MDLLFLALSWALAADPGPQSQLDPHIPCRACTLREAVDRAGLPWPPPGFRLTLDKSDHEMTGWVGPVPIKTWRVGLGEPTGDKVQQGDRRTPTGRLRVVTRNPRSRFHLFLGLSYADTRDADRGLAAGLVTAAQATAIRQADAAGRVPPWNTALGGAIGIHGGGADRDWTLGCVALTNDEIEALWAAAPLGTWIDIRE